MRDKCVSWPEATGKGFRVKKEGKSTVDVLESSGDNTDNGKLRSLSLLIGGDLSGRSSVITEWGSPSMPIVQGQSTMSSCLMCLFVLTAKNPLPLYPFSLQSLANSNSFW